MQTPANTRAEEQKPFLLERVIEWSARNIFLVLILTVFGIAGGIWALKRTPLELADEAEAVVAVIGGQEEVVSGAL